MEASKDSSSSIRRDKKGKEVVDESLCHPANTRWAGEEDDVRACEEDEVVVVQGRFRGAGGGARGPAPRLIKGRRPLRWPSPRSKYLPEATLRLVTDLVIAEGRERESRMKRRIEREREGDEMSDVVVVVDAGRGWFMGDRSNDRLSNKRLPVDRVREQ